MFRLSRSACSPRLASVTSEKDTTAPSTSSLAASRSGEALTRSHLTVPDGWRTPITTPRTGSPVVRAIVDGRSSPRAGLPSLHTVCHSGSSEVLPVSVAASRPRIALAVGLLSTIRPSASCTTTPSARLSTIALCHRSLRSRASRVRPSVESRGAAGVAATGSGPAPADDGAFDPAAPARLSASDRARRFRCLLP